MIKAKPPSSYPGQSLVERFSECSSANAQSALAGALATDTELCKHLISLL
jgi:hypothetical protein